MTERWRRELRVLERVGPPEDLLERARQGPQLPLPGPRLGTRVLPALLAVALVAGGGLGAIAILRHGGEASPSGRGSVSFAALWPEQSLSIARAIQLKLDDGDPTVQWRLDALATARAFARQELGWGDASANASSGDLSGHGPVVVEMAPPPYPCPTPPPGCPAWLLARGTEVTLERLVRPSATGIWSVTGVAGPVSGGLRLAVPLRAGQDVPSGRQVAVRAKVPEGAELSAGYGYFGCSGTTTLGTPVARKGSAFTFRVGGARLDEICPGGGGSVGSEPRPGEPGHLQAPRQGYVFVVVTHGSNPDEPWYPLLGPPPNDVPVVWMAAIPVRFVPVGSEQG